MTTRSFAWPKDCDWPNGYLFRMHDEPGEHDPCYLIDPAGAMYPFVHHGVNGVDQARVKFIMDACNNVSRVRQIIRDSLDSQPDTSDPVQHNKWLVQTMQEIEKLIS